MVVVINVGLNKTGTTALCESLRCVGVSPVSWYGPSPLFHKTTVAARICDNISRGVSVFRDIVPCAGSSNLYLGQIDDISALPGEEADYALVPQLSDLEALIMEAKRQGYKLVCSHRGDVDIWLRSVQNTRTQCGLFYRLLRKFKSFGPFFRCYAHVLESTAPTIDPESSVITLNHSLGKIFISNHDESMTLTEKSSLEIVLGTLRHLYMSHLANVQSLVDKHETECLFIDIDNCSPSVVRTFYEFCNVDSPRPDELVRANVTAGNEERVRVSGIEVIR